MLPDIKNFSDLTAIDVSELLELKIELKRHGDIDFVFSVNDEKFTETTFIRRYPIDTQFTFSCEILNFNQNPGVLEIISIAINGKEILPKYQYLGNPPRTIIDSPRPWTLVSSQPFYVWYHHISGQGWIA